MVGSPAPILFAPVKTLMKPPMGCTDMGRKVVPLYAILVPIALVNHEEKSSLLWGGSKVGGGHRPRNHSSGAKLSSYSGQGYWGIMSRSHRGAPLCTEAAPFPVRRGAPLQEANREPNTEGNGRHSCNEPQDLWF